MLNNKDTDPKQPDSASSITRQQTISPTNGRA